MIYVYCPQCGDEIEMRVFEDSDGDHTVPYGIRRWNEAEISAQKCKCELTFKQIRGLEVCALEKWEEDVRYGYDPDNYSDREDY